MNKFKEGQALVYVPSEKRRGGPRPIVVNKIGRQWVYFEGLGLRGRFDKSTLRVDGGGYASPGQVYLTMEEYQQELDLSEAWSELRNKTQVWLGSEGLTARRVRLAMGILLVGGDTDPLKVITDLVNKLPNGQGLETYYAREELVAVRRLFGV